MSEESKRMVGGDGPLVAKPLSEDRKSTNCAAVKVSDGKKFIIKSADMKEDMQQEAVDIAISAFEKHSVGKDVAEYIKKEFDKSFKGVFLVPIQWNCDIHTSSYVTHETNHFVCFYLDSKAVHSRSNLAESVLKLALMMPPS